MADNHADLILENAALRERVLQLEQQVIQLGGDPHESMDDEDEDSNLFDEHSENEDEDAADEDDDDDDDEEEEERRRRRGRSRRYWNRSRKRPTLPFCAWEHFERRVAHSNHQISFVERSDHFYVHIYSRRSDTMEISKRL